HFINDLFMYICQGTSTITPRAPFVIFWKFARIGERLSPYVSLCCIGMGMKLLFS
ncbi:hypothetical protein MP638_000934, partial [Amoeboaphelidium occidentale]